MAAPSRPARSYHDLVAEARSRIRELGPAEVMEAQQRGERLTVIDVRDANEVNLGSIPGATHLSRGNLEKLIEGVAPRDARIVLVCSSGSRSALAAVSLQEMGYADVASMSGGVQGWIEAGGELD
jgi:rhodanese-related sulfurtransferase